MKTIYLLSALVLFFFCPALYSQDEKPPKRNYFAMVYTTGENWDTTKQAHEQQFFSDHSKHLSALRKEGKIIIGGRFSDKGLMIIECTDETEATRLINSDPSVKNKVFKAEVFPFMLFYEGTLSK